MNILEYENYHEEKKHGEPEFPYNTYLCSIPLDFKEVPTHWHDEMEIIYIKKGTGLITVDFQEYTPSAPAIVLILPGQLHSIAQYRQETMEYENIIFHPDLLISRQKDLSISDLILPLMHGQLALPTVFSAVYPHYPEVSAPIDACDEICKTKPQGYELYIKSQLFQFLYILINRCQSYTISTRNRKRLDTMKPILKYLENHYSEKISIAEIAEVAGFSESHFMRYFKEVMGFSFITYLNDYRLTMAARMLAASDSAILSISEKVGFHNLSHFNRAFKKKYKMSPKDYRKHMDTRP